MYKIKVVDHATMWLKDEA